MFAVIKTGGKQYKVAENDVIDIEKLEADEGATVEFDSVLALGDTVGLPTIAGAKVTGEVLSQFRGEKVIIFKKHRRQNYRRKNGHRQFLTRVRITGFAGV
ncbi:50S ribosomal protein L21 [Rhodospirillum rubrum]|uniref:Large ribosomal subunit protein bL21 n=1 Tax=Rhodospirillum rubrum (strain ATCC 11170 / ATH 1.1.1 / DSM 467 / LMG 4362 / NCIMB 8255 / S1) TaxID=269796 RepID=RL21_RHORT|nr:50S ribosomal protein L21 [Rhodospirillum rubrum]Q2RV02.1 RecName: Full=Large ribosomal subunit protein bL21; AltName: Full=50S ribosomal protein L21 [Rhodospirillum rubrum ATCC 11170]ABC22043.1 LSU ribosomal protein L21P [Rhodospirillum rubrum ATCC 11170]AEO47755.1 50S ribosomal protein L21P [Rhodospirillum rubrum F11]MBK1665140.1 50S ribosomal protein L21 [Rhodospirillum rubrum]MBK1676385.1 50S ribosomal protein L21 [Rhodospirillum rubrum]MBK5953626.1 50S ribosomal protein L21 [Rhodospir